MARRRVRSWSQPEAKKKKKKKKRRKVGDRAMEIVDRQVKKVPKGPGLGKEDPSEPNDEVERVAQRLGIDLSLECPVCRSLEECECTEEDRSFQRRIRFEADEKTPRCQRCSGALSCLLIPRAGSSAPYDLSHMVPVWGCVSCHGASLATVLVNASRGK